MNLSWLNVWILAILCISMGPIVAQAQKRCGSMELLNQLTPEQRRYAPGGDVFEARMKLARTANARLPICDSGKLIRIPVVFHIIHKGEAVGIGTNIADARMIEQIQILNEDYRRMAGTRGGNSDPRGFDSQIEFYLACQDPNGAPSNGIVRVKGSQPTWSLADNDALKNTSVWPTNRYFNVWVCDLQGFIGYASFPVTDLPWNGPVVFSRPDGVVLATKAVGYSFNNPRPYSSNLYGYGRTLTHESGHFFGLIHIWGDGDCSATDFCDDTPPQSAELDRCPLITSDTADLHCPGQPPIMFRNYMGYVWDSCMNIFTHDQVARMRYVLCHTPARDSLEPLLPCYLGVKPSSAPAFHIKNNPNAEGLFTFQINDSGIAQIEVWSIEGRRVSSQTLTVTSDEDQSLDLSLLSAGMYCVRISLNSHTATTRFPRGTVPYRQ